MSWIVLVVLFCVGTLSAFPRAEKAEPSGIEQQKKEVKGTITDDMGPVIGASIIIKGTTEGTTTDLDGNFVLNVPEGATLQVSYIGYNTQEITYKGEPTLTIKMSTSAKNLDEVVVTAMGIERKSKTLTYATQTVGGQELTRAKETNMINSLQGKSAGLVITPGSSGPGGSSSMIIRGNKSAQGNNMPLVVVDGMPMANNAINQSVGDFGAADHGDQLSNLNPDDIASINVLKGASAAALYGSMAANGVIMITTKKGREGAIRVDFSSNVDVEMALTTPKLQKTYGALVTGDNLSADSWGAKITGEAKGVNRVSDFFRAGPTYINSINLTGGSEKMQTFASYANTYADGIVPNNNMRRHNMTLRETMKLFNNKVTVDATLNYIIQDISNRPVGGQYFNPIPGLYTFPANGDFGYYKQNYATFNPILNYDTQNWYRDVNQDLSANPYWVINKNRTYETRHRTMAAGTVKWDITNYLNIQGRLNYDRFADATDQRLSAGTSNTLLNSPLGEYRTSTLAQRQFYGDVLINFNKNFGKQWSLGASAGTSFLDFESLTTNYTSRNPVLPNYFVLANATQNDSSNGATRRRLNSVFATAQVGFNDYLFLDVTGRNDWASTLAFTPNGSYFYPSVGLTGVISDMAKLPEVFNLLKVRGSYSIVGNDVPAYITNPLNSFSRGQVTINTSVPFKDMKPEKLKSWEAGFDLAMFNNRFEMDLTWYKTNNTNQYFSMSVPNGTGYSTYYFNAGNIQNSGFETTLSYNMSFAKDWFWKTSFNMAYNENVIKELDDRLEYVNIGSITGVDLRLKKGGSYGDIYGKDFKRDINGAVLLDDGGRPQIGSDRVYLGNVNPKWNMGWGNTFSYKDFTLYFLFDGAIGGKVLDATESVLDLYGVSQRSADARDRGKVDLGHGVSVDPYKYYTTIGAKGAVASPYIYSATNFRLRELTFGYTFKDLFGISKNLSLNFVAKNLFFIYKDAPNDPGMAAMSTQPQARSVSYLGIPTTRTFGFNLKATF